MATTLTQETPANATTASAIQFKVGWSYDVFLRKNGLPPSPHASEQWLTLSREQSRAQVEKMRELNLAGAKTVCKQRAVFNAKDGRFDTSLTARVVQPGCKDEELILDCLIRAQKSASKRISGMKTAAAAMGVITS